MEPLNREHAMPEMMDPTGRKWVIKGQRGSALVHARPDPDRSDAQIPKEFGGQWTSPSVLKEKIQVWLGQQWTRTERLQQRARIQEHANLVEEEKIPQKTAEKSLAELPAEIREALGEIIAIKEEETDATEDSKAEAAEASDGREAATDHNDEPTGRIADSGSQKEEAQEKEVDYSSLSYQELLAIAKEKGIQAKRKVDILLALEE